MVSITFLPNALIHSSSPCSLTLSLNRRTFSENSPCYDHLQGVIYLAYERSGEFFAPDELLKYEPVPSSISSSPNITVMPFFRSFAKSLFLHQKIVAVREGLVSLLGGREIIGK